MRWSASGPEDVAIPEPAEEGNCPVIVTPWGMTAWSARLG
jgi:hypothetical protein